MYSCDIPSGSIRPVVPARNCDGFNSACVPYYFTTFFAVALSCWSLYLRPYQRQRYAINTLEKEGMSFTLNPSGPAWLRRWCGKDSSSK